MTNKGTLNKPNQLRSPRILILRFSSLGDVVQCLSVPAKLRALWPDAEIQWVTRTEFAPLIENHPDVKRIWPTSRKTPLLGSPPSLWSLAGDLHEIRFTHVYDAHSSLRSKVLILFLKLRSLRQGKWPAFQVLRKSQKRWKRFLLFKLRWNTYRRPFSGQRDLLEPLTQWGANEELPPCPQIFFTKQILFDFKSMPDHSIALAPSAAHPLKRWPLDHWKKLIELCPQENFVVLGGAEDQFLASLETLPNVTNLAGKTNFIETAQIVQKSKVLICNDTGVMHFGEQLGHPTVALMGPAPFGFPSRPSTKVMERDLSCRPCSKHGQGPCTNKIYQACLATIDPFEVYRELQILLQKNGISPSRRPPP